MIIVERQTVLNKRRHWYIVYVTWYYITLHSAYVWALFNVCFMVLHYIQVLCGIYFDESCINEEILHVHAKPTP